MAKGVPVLGLGWHGIPMKNGLCEPVSVSGVADFGPGVPSWQEEQKFQFWRVFDLYIAIFPSGWED